MSEMETVENLDYSALSEKEIDEITEYYDEYFGPYDDCKYCGMCNFDNNNEK